MSMLKKQKLPWILSIGVAALLIGGSVAAYWLWVRRNPVLGEAPVGFELVPQEALLTATISTDAAQWQQLQLYGTPATQTALKQQLTQLQDNFLKATGLNYEEDIQPILGKTITVAYLGSKPPVTESTPEKGQQLPSSLRPDLIILPIQSPNQARQLFEKLKTRNTTQFFERTYKGIPIRETHTSQAQNYSVALLGRFLTLTTYPKLTEQVVDTSTGGASAAMAVGYREALPKIDTSNSFGQFYLNVPVFTAGLAANSNTSLSPEKVAASQPMQGVAATVALEPQGMRFQGISWLKPNSTQTYRVENTTTRLPRRLPSDTLLMMSGGNLRQWWENHSQNAEFNSLFPVTPQKLNSAMKAIIGLDLEKDLVPWMGDEYSLALVPASPEVLKLPGTQLSPSLGAGVVLMIEARDRSRAQDTLKRLDQLIANRYGFQVDSTKVGGQSVVSWTSPYGGVNATHGWLEGNVAFLTIGAPIAGAILPEPKAPLIQSSLFQQVVPTTPNPNNGQFFLDVERTVNKGNLYLPRFLSPNQRMFAQAIRAIGFTGAIQDKRSTRFDLFLQMKTATPATPTPSPDNPTETPNASPTPQASPRPSP
jgi:hypothetical protein